MPPEGGSLGRCHLFCKICLGSQGRLSFSLSDTHFSQAKVLGRLGRRKKRLCWSTPPSSGSLKNLHLQYYQSRATQREPGSSSPIIASRSQGKPEFQGPHGCCQRGQGCLFPTNSLPPNFHGEDRSAELGKLSKRHHPVSDGVSGPFRPHSAPLKPKPSTLDNSFIKGSPLKP